MGWTEHASCMVQTIVCILCCTDQGCTDHVHMGANTLAHPLHVLSLQEAFAAGKHLDCMQHNICSCRVGKHSVRLSGNGHHQTYLERCLTALGMVGRENVYELCVTR
jgi:hypothetical protein